MKTWRYLLRAVTIGSAVVVAFLAIATVSIVDTRALVGVLAVLFVIEQLADTIDRMGWL